MVDCGHFMPVRVGPLSVKFWSNSAKPVDKALEITFSPDSRRICHFTFLGQRVTFTSIVAPKKNLFLVRVHFGNSMKSVNVKVTVFNYT